MLKKFLLFILIILIIYILLVFNIPLLASNIEKIFWINWLGQRIIDFKKTTDRVYTNIPTQEEFKEAYLKTLEWAENLKEETLSWANNVKWKIDNVRETISWAVDSYNTVKTSVEDTKKQIETTVNTIKTTTEKINTITNAVENFSSWTLNNN